MDLKSFRAVLGLLAGSIFMGGLVPTAAHAAEPIDQAFRPSSCYDVLKPELELSSETITEMHQSLLDGKPRTYSVILRTEVGMDGIAKKVDFAKKESIDELNEVAQTISEVAAVKCMDTTVSAIEDAYQFGIEYKDGAKPGTVTATAHFTRFPRPLADSGKLTNDVPFCEVTERDERGIAEKVDCTRDGSCEIVGKPPKPYFPRSLEKSGQVGQVDVNVTVDATGKVLKTKTYRSSGDSRFDAVATKAAERVKMKCTGQNPAREYGITYSFVF